MELTKQHKHYRLKTDIEKLSIQRLFEILGFDTSIYNSNGTRSFWTANYGELEYIYYDARKKYIELVKQNHPESENGNHNNMVLLNQVWGRIQYLFACKGVTNKQTDIVKQKQMSYKKNIRPGKLLEDRNLIINIINCYKLGNTVNDVADYLKVHHNTVSKILKQHNIKIKKGGFNNKINNLQNRIEEIKEDYKYLPEKQIAKKYNVSFSTIRRFARKNNLNEVVN